MPHHLPVWHPKKTVLNQCPRQILPSHRRLTPKTIRQSTVMRVSPPCCLPIARLCLSCFWTSSRYHSSDVTTISNSSRRYVDSRHRILRRCSPTDQLAVSVVPAVASHRIRPGPFWFQSTGARLVSLRARNTSRQSPADSRRDFRHNNSYPRISTRSSPSERLDRAIAFFAVEGVYQRAPKRTQR